MTKQNSWISETYGRIASLEERIRELELSAAGLKQGNRYLKKQSDFYLGTINAIPDFIVHTDLNGQIRFINDAVVKSIGLTRDELDGKNAFFFLPEHERKKAIYNSMFILEDKPGLNEFTLVLKNGQRTPFEINGDVFLDKDGNPSGFIFVCRDITLRRQTELAMKNMEERLQSINFSLPGMIFQFFAGDGGVGRLNYVSDQARDFFGLYMKDLDELYSFFISNIYIKDRENFINSVVEAIKYASPWNFVFRFIKPSGELKWLHGLSIPSHHENGLFFNGIILDITELKIAERTSRISEEKFSQVFMTVPDCVAIIRFEDGYILDINNAFEKITGWNRDECIGKMVKDLNFWEDLAERDFLREELLKNCDVVNREFRFLKKDSQVRSGIYSARSIRIGSYMCVLAVIQDITELKRIETEKIRLERQMLQIQKMDAIGQLAGGVAHDFNNILSGIQGNVSLILLKSKPDDYTHQRLLRIDESVKRGADLTKQLLGFARGGKYEPEIFSINDLVEKSINFFIETRKEIETELKLQADVFPVEADVGQIEQVLLNLYINAAQAMPGGGRISVETYNITISTDEVKNAALKKGNYVKISVSDNGTGMDSETLHRIFEPFFTTKSQSGGTGLGLASAYGIIQNHNGLINVYSEPGLGTTFNIYLPSSDKDITDKLQTDRSILAYGKGGILFVDDEQVIVNTANELLTTLGYTVFTALNGPDAIKVLNRNRGAIDLIIMDLVMPGIKGLTLFKKLRSISPDIKVIISSGYSIQGEVQKVMECGCRGFIQKPYSITDFAALVQKTLNS